MSAALFGLFLLFQEPTSTNCSGYEECQAAHTREQQQRDELNTKKKDLEKQRAGLEKKSDTCRGAKACAEVSAKLDDVNKELTEVERQIERVGKTPAPPPPPPPAPEESEPKRKRAKRQRDDGDRPPRSSLVQAGGGYSFHPFPDIINLQGGSWSVGIFGNWYKKRMQFSFGTGFRGYHVSGSDSVYDVYTDTYSNADVTVNSFVVPIEFRFGGGPSDKWFVYGMLGGDVGIALIEVYEFGSTMNEIGFAWNPAKVGVGGYVDVARGFTIGAEFQSDVLRMIRGGGPVADIQLKIGYLFGSR